MCHLPFIVTFKLEFLTFAPMFCVQIKEICPIDLLIGGSPCTDLSFVNPKRKGLFGEFRFVSVIKMICSKFVPVICHVPNILNSFERYV